VTTADHQQQMLAARQRTVRKHASGNPKGAIYPSATVAMADAGAPTSNGSQVFFIVHRDSTSGLGGSAAGLYTPFATVTSGLNIVKNAAKDGYSCQYALLGGGAPKEKVIIDSVTIKKA
jgi:cyclophilin family peptidyl-prolyl cis-trans isomerase